MAKEFAHLTLICPLPPARTGIADYIEEQIQAYADIWSEIEVVVETPARTNFPANVTLTDFRTWMERPLRDTRLLYHVGNNLDHAYVVEALSARPGTLWLHDFVLHHLMTGMYLHQGKADIYEALLVAEYGEVGRGLARRRLAGLFSPYEYFLAPLNQSVIDRAANLITHSNYIRRQIQTSHPQIKSATIPHHADPRAFEIAKKDKAASALGLDPQLPVVSVFGFATPAKQIGLVIESLLRLSAEGLKFQFCVVGENHIPVQDLDRLKSDRGLWARTHFTGHVELEKFYEFMAATDVIAALRFPSAGESSGVLSRAFAAGKSCIVFDFGSFAEIPDEIVRKIPLDTVDATTLTSALRELLSDAALRSRMGAKATAYARTELNLKICVQKASAFLNATLNTGKSP